MKYIKRFDTLSAQTEYLNSADIDTYLGYVDENDTVYYDDAIPVRYDNKYLTIETLTAGNLSISVAGSNVFQYSLDDGSTWNNLTFGQTVAVEANKKVLFKAEGLEIIGGNSGIGRINYSGDFNVYGNVMSLVYGDNFVGQEVMSNFQFGSLFENAVTLISAENLTLPAKTLTQGCYDDMFAGCTNMTSAPELPATTLAKYCYNDMFVFCKNLNYIKCLATDISAKGCTTEWVLNVGSSGTFVKNAAMNNWTTGINGIPSGWTVVDA